MKEIKKIDSTTKILLAFLIGVFLGFCIGLSLERQNEFERNLEKAKINMGVLHDTRTM
jgi:hypothetical protein